MAATSVRFNEKTKKLLDEYCFETGKKTSEAIRTLLDDSLDRYNKGKEVGFVDSVGPDGLMVNQKRAIRASVESTLILRKIAKSVLKDDASLNEIDIEVSRILKEGWQYDNK